MTDLSKDIQPFLEGPAKLVKRPGASEVKDGMGRRLPAMPRERA